MVDYVKLAAVSKRLVEANGRTVTLYKRDRSPAAAGQPWRGPDAVPTDPDGATLSATVCFVPPTGSGLGSSVFRDGEAAQRFDQIGLLAFTSADGEDVREFNTILDGTRVWSIDRVETLQPAGQGLLYALGLNG